MSSRRKCRRRKKKNTSIDGPFVFRGVSWQAEGSESQSKKCDETKRATKIGRKRGGRYLLLVSFSLFFCPSDDEVAEPAMVKRDKPIGGHCYGCALYESAMKSSPL